MKGKAKISWKVDVSMLMNGFIKKELVKIANNRIWLSILIIGISHLLKVKNFIFEVIILSFLYIALVLIVIVNCNTGKV